MSGSPQPQRGPDPASITVRRLSEQDWRSHRDLRREMLAAEPDAFWTTLEQVAEFTEDQWRDSAAGIPLRLQAQIGDEAVGTLGIDPIGYDEDVLLDADTVNIVSVYVRPAARGGAVIRALVAAALDEIRALGRHRLLLEVTSDNASARRRYASLGFRPTGITHPHPRRAHLREVEYAARIEDVERALAEYPVADGSA